MKKIVRGLLFGFLIFSFSATVNATNYAVKTLIPVDTVATVGTDLFTYQDFSYQSAVDSKGNAKITFNQIVNRTNSKIPVSIDILLFNSDQKNIGFVTYCTDKDLDSEYNQFKLDKKQSTPFSITVTSRYFATYQYTENSVPKTEKYQAKDVKYIAVLDDNEYCKIGGYDNYKEMKLDEIVKLTSSGQEGHDVVSQTTNNPELMKKIIFGVVGFVCLAIVLFVLKLIYNKIASRTLSFGKPNFKREKEDTLNDTKNNDTNNGQQSFIENGAGNEVIDLGYHGEVSDESQGSPSLGNNNVNDVGDLFNISQGESLSDSNLKSTDSKEKKEEKKIINNKEGESDLSKFFK